MTAPNHQQIANRMSALEKKLDAFMAEMRVNMTDVKRDVAETKEIVEAWSAIKTISKGMKWLGGLLTTIAAGWLIFKTGLAAMLK